MVLLVLVRMIVALDLFGDVFSEVEAHVFPVSLIVIIGAMFKTKVEFVALCFLIAFAWGIIMSFMRLLFLLMTKAQVLSLAVDFTVPTG